MPPQEDSEIISEDIKTLVCEIIKNHNLKDTCEIKYYPGSQAGDGYATKTIAVDITDEETSLDLFLKCALSIGDKMPSIHLIYANEIYFYKTIFKTYKEFWENKALTDGFRNVPVCYGFDESAKIIALENLRKKGYTLFDRFTYMNDEHLELTLRTFAKFHAISFAMKDQRIDLHDEFCEKCPNFFSVEKVFTKIVCNSFTDFIAQLHPVEDNDILRKCTGLDSKINDQIANMNNYLTDYSIFTKGDCWANNMMILYEQNDTEHPRDVMLIDWQCVTRASPVHDIQALFYSVASKGTVDNYKYYLDIYYEELSKRIKELGSDPKFLYPRPIFEKEWIDYGTFALGLSLVLLKAMLCESKNAPTFERDMDENEMLHMFSNMTDNQEEYMMRARYIVRHMMDIGIINFTCSESEKVSAFTSN